MWMCLGRAIQGEATAGAKALSHMVTWREEKGGQREGREDPGGGRQTKGDLWLSLSADF